MENELCTTCGWERDDHGIKLTCVHWDHQRGYVYYADRHFVPSGVMARR